MYEVSYIKLLLEQYFEGNTSIEEERILKAYFNQEAVAAELRSYQSLFQYFKQEQSIMPSEQLEQKIVAQLPTTKVHQMNRNDWRWAIGIAASLALMMASWFALEQWQTQEQVAEINWEQYEPEDPEEALEYTKAALELLAQKLNGGASQAAKELDKISRISDVFDK